MDTWALLLLIFVVFGGDKSLSNLIESKAFDETYNDILGKIKDMPADEIKEKLVKHYEEHKDTIQQLNACYQQNKEVSYDE